LLKSKLLSVGDELLCCGESALIANEGWIDVPAHGCKYTSLHDWVRAVYKRHGQNDPNDPNNRNEDVQDERCFAVVDAVRCSQRSRAFPVDASHDCDDAEQFALADLMRRYVENRQKAPHPPVSSLTSSKTAVSSLSSSSSPSSSSSSSSFSHQMRNTLLRGTAGNGSFATQSLIARPNMLSFAPPSSSSVQIGDDMVDDNDDDELNEADDVDHDVVLSSSNAKKTKKKTAKAKGKVDVAKRKRLPASRASKIAPLDLCVNRSRHASETGNDDDGDDDAELALSIQVALDSPSMSPDTLAILQPTFFTKPAPRLSEVEVQAKENVERQDATVAAANNNNNNNDIIFLSPAIFSLSKKGNSERRRVVPFTMADESEPSELRGNEDDLDADGESLPSPNLSLFDKSSLVSPLQHVSPPSATPSLGVTVTPAASLEFDSSISSPSSSLSSGFNSPATPQVTSQFTPTQRQACDSQFTPTQRQCADSQVTPTQRQHVDSQLTPTQRQCADSQVTPTQRQHVDSQLTPTQRQHVDSQLTPTQRQHVDSQLTPTQRQHVDSQLTPTQRQHVDSQLTPTQRQHVDSQLTPTQRQHVDSQPTQRKRRYCQDDSQLPKLFQDSQFTPTEEQQGDSQFTPTDEQREFEFSPTQEHEPTKRSASPQFATDCSSEEEETQLQD
jgi:hypothetical protein